MARLCMPASHRMQRFPRLILSLVWALGAIGASAADPQLYPKNQTPVLDPVLFENIHRGLLQLERNTRDLQQSVMSIRLVPISIVFSRFPRLVRELAALAHSLEGLSPPSS